MYYLRTRAAADAIKFTVDQQALARRKAARTVTAAAPDTEPLKVLIGLHCLFRVCHCRSGLSSKVYKADKFLCNYLVTGLLQVPPD